MHRRGLLSIVIAALLVGCGGHAALTATGPGDGSADAVQEPGSDSTTDAPMEPQDATADGYDPKDSSVPPDASRDSMPDDASSEPCVPTTCAAAYDGHGAGCGYIEDECGHVLYCGSCQCPMYCNGGGFGLCGGSNCVGPGCNPACCPSSCASLGLGCGLAGDGCGGILDCGGCLPPLACGAGGRHYQCGDGGACLALSCADQQVGCGPAGNGCGNIIQCGNCLPPQTCGGGGVRGQCGGDGGVQSCGGLSCADQGIECGPADDGCGNAIDCGSCTPPQACGGGGPGKCG